MNITSSNIPDQYKGRLTGDIVKAVLPVQLSVLVTDTDYFPPRTTISEFVVDDLESCTDMILIGNDLGGAYVLELIDRNRSALYYRVVGNAEQSRLVYRVLLAETPIEKVCADCGSDNVAFDGPIRWSVETQSYEVYDIYDKGHRCESCGGTTIIDQAVDV